MNAFALSVLTPCSPFLLSRFTDCFVSCFLAWKRKLIFYITCRELIYFHILSWWRIFVAQYTYISKVTKLYFKHENVVYEKHILHLSRNKTKPTKWPVRPARTRIRLGIRTVWSEPSLSAWRTLVFLAIHCEHSERRLWSDWADAQDDLSLRWAHRLVCWFCHAAAHLYAPYVCTGPSVWVKSVKLARP